MCTDHSVLRHCPSALVLLLLDHHPTTVRASAGLSNTPFLSTSSWLRMSGSGVQIVAQSIRRRPGDRPSATQSECGTPPNGTAPGYGVELGFFISLFVLRSRRSDLTVVLYSWALLGKAVSVAPPSGGPLV
jgi:hypothetical protein